MRSRPMRRRKFSEIQTNIELNEYGWFSVVIPAGRENLIKNPSFETNANGAVAVGGTIARTAVWQSHGAVSLLVTPGAGVNDGMYYDDPSHDFDVAENTLYWPSFDFKADGGRKYKAYMARQYSGTQLGAAYPFTATGNPQRIEFPYREGDNTLVDNLVAYWKLTEATGATRMDSVGNNDLVPAGGANPGPSQITGKVGNAARFTRANTERLTLADNTDISTGNVDFIFAGWVRLTTKPAAIMALLSKWGAAGSRDYALQWNNVSDRFVFTVSGDGTASTNVVANQFGPPATGVWYFVEAWHDSVNDQIGIRVNRGTPDTMAHATGAFDSATQFILGDLLAVQYLDGDLDEWGFWKGRLLSSTELDTLYNGGFGQTYNFLQRRLYIVKDNDTNVRPFYVDGLQFEAGDFPTTLAIGDMVGLVPNFDDYYWTGAPHASTSVRVANSADGGRVMNLRQLGLRVISHVGLGMTGLSLALTPLGNGGAFYQGTTVRDRSFNIIGEINGDEYQTLDMYEQALTDAFSPNRVSPQQPIKLLYQPLDDCGNSIGETLEIACLPDGDFLQMQTDNLNARRLALPFRLYLPWAARNATDQGTPLSYQELAISTGGFSWVDTNGNWRVESLSGVNVILPLPDGTLAIGGGFLNAGGLADADYLVRYDPATRTLTAFNATPLNAAVYALALLPDGNLAVGGTATNAGGNANADYLFKLNLTTGLFSSFNATPLTGGTTAVYALAVLPDGNLAAGGDFLNAGGFANADYLTKVTLSTGAFSAFNATPLLATVYALAVDNSFSYLVIGGAFLNAGGANGDYVCRLLLSTGAVSQLVTANPLTATSAVFSIGILPNGDYLIGGDLLNHNGIVGYNGTSFYDLGNGTGAGGTVKTILVKSDGQVAVGGVNFAFGLFGFSDSLGFWTGSAWTAPDIRLPVGDQVNGLAQVNGSLFIGSGSTGLFIPFSDVTTISNNGTGPSYPSLVIRGPGIPVSLKNFTNGDVVYFNLSLIAGEEAALTFKQSGATFTSNLRGNILGTIIPGSTTNFKVEHDTNLISTFITYTANELNDGGNQLSQYSLQGVTVLNSDNGRLYVSIVNLGGANRRADFYSDSARTLLVAQTGTYAAGGFQAVTQANSSGITGGLTVDAVGAADVDISIDVPVVTMSWEPTYASLSGAVRPRVF